MDNDSTVPKRGRGSVWLGLVLGVLLAVLSFKFGPYLSLPLRRLLNLGGFNPIAWFSFLGVLQWIYILPLVFILRAKRHPRTATGLLVVGLLVMVPTMAVLIFLLIVRPHC